MHTMSSPNDFGLDGKVVTGVGEEARAATRLTAEAEAVTGGERCCTGAVRERGARSPMGVGLAG